MKARDHVTTLGSSARQLRTQISNMQNALSKTEVKLQPATSINLRLSEITALAGECGLEAQYVQTGAAAPGAKFGQVPIQFAGSGSYRTCVTFLHRLRNDFPDTGVK